MKQLKTIQKWAFLLFAGVAFNFASAQCPGVLMVNEISNGKSGQQEFIELIAAASTDAACASATEVDISNWIIDDNNGFFSGSSAFSDLGISQGHWRLTEDDVWTSFPVGAYLVLFNALDYDASITAFNNAAFDANGIYSTDSAVYVAVGFSLAIEKNSSVPAADSLGGDPNYCTSGSYSVANTWSTAGLRNACGGDGIQTRCPGCKIGLGEPSFFHGFSYGSDNAAQTNPNVDFLDAAHISFAPMDTICATGKAFYLSAGTGANAPEVSGNWSVGADSLVSTPGAPNSAANATFRDNVESLTNTYNRCPAPEVSEVAKGVLIVTEVSNGPSGSCEYVEMIVAACEDDQFAQYVNIQGWILDDNAGTFNRFRDCGSGKSITSGHLRLAYNDVWDSVAVGSIIVVYNYNDNCYNLDTASFNGPDANGVYWEPVGGPVSGVNPNIESSGSYPSSSDCDYCNPSGNVYEPATSWTGKVGLSNSGDGFQVRCPGCNDIETGEPAFYHGLGYGSLSGWLSIAAGTNDLGGPVENYSSSSRIKYVFVGEDETEAGSAAFWDRESADTAGTPPASLGQVEANFIGGIQFGAFSFPCCASSSESSGKRALNNNTFDEQGFVKNVYPNPTTGRVNFEMQISAHAQFRITDISGRVVVEREVNKETTSMDVDLNGQPRGVYIYQIITNEGVASGKIILE